MICQSLEWCCESYEGRSGMKYLRSQNGEARMLEVQGSEVQVKCAEKRVGGNKIKQKRILRIDLPAIFKSDFSSVWILTTSNQLILVLSKQVFDHLCWFQVACVSVTGGF